MAGRLFLFLTFVTTFAKPVAHQHRHRKRYDLDGNGIPDYCVTESNTAHCLQQDGTWVAFPASQTTTVQAATSVAAPAQTQARASPLQPAPAKLPTGGPLPSSSTFKQDNGTKWHIEYVGDVKFSSGLDLVGDKGRTSKIGERVIWNFGDMMCPPDYTKCGFGFGPAFYGTDDVMTVDTNGVRLVQENDFLKPWAGDPKIQAPFEGWGMDTSNVAELNSTHGVVYAMESWRGGSAGSTVSDRGLAAGSVTLGPTKPVATRIGPLMSNGDAIGIGMIAIMRDGDYVYSYAPGGNSGLIVGRVRADESVFDASKYEFLQADTANTWVTPGRIPLKSEESNYGVQRTDPSLGQVNCPVYGSIFYNNYLRKYTMFCDVYMLYLNMFVADNPWGPWSQEYNLLSSFSAYGAMAHPQYSPNGSHKVVYLSHGPNTKFHTFKITFDY